MISLQKPHLFYDYFTALGVGEHFFSFRHEVKQQLEAQLAALASQTSMQQETNQAAEPAEAKTYVISSS
jgi:hypothetical protein